MGKVVREGKVVPAERVRTLLEADSILAEARDQAAAILDAAEEEREAQRERLHDSLRREARAEVAAMLIEARSRRAKILEDAGEDIIALALEVARSIVRREVEVDSTWLTDVCDEALSRLVSASAVILRINSADRGIFESWRKNLGTRLAEGVSLRIISDEEIERGGCIVESDVGRIDARLDTQLLMVERALKDLDG